MNPCDVCEPPMGFGMELQKRPRVSRRTISFSLLKKSRTIQNILDLCRAECGEDVDLNMLELGYQEIRVYGPETDEEFAVRLAGHKARNDNYLQWCKDNDRDPQTHEEYMHELAVSEAHNELREARIRVLQLEQLLGPV
jgi:hypothetical protein